MVKVLKDRIELLSPFWRRTVHIVKGIGSLEIAVKGAESHYFMPLEHINGWGVPYEAAVKVNGVWIECAPWARGNRLWPKNDVKFDFIRVERSEGKLGEKAVIVCRTAGEALPQLELLITYELSATLPVMRKQVCVRNVSSKSIVVDNIACESIYEGRIGRNVAYFHNYRQDVLLRSPRYAGFAEFAFNYDMNCEVPPGGELKSFDLYEIALDSAPMAATVWTTRALRRIAQRDQDARIKFQLSGCHSFDELANTIDQCAEVGIEDVTFFYDQVWSNIGDYKLRPDIFPEGESQLRRLLDRIRGLGMRPGIYCSYSIAWHGSDVRERNLEWELLDENGIPFDPATFGNMCPLSGWGDFILGKFNWLIDSLGFGFLDIDGPTDVPCFSSSHKHGRGNYVYHTWLWELKLFETLRRKGVDFTIPRGLNYILMGADKIPGGYTEEDFCHSTGLHLLANYRASMAYMRAKLPAWASWGFLALGKYHGNSISITDESCHELDHGLGGLLGYGNGTSITGNRCFTGLRTRETFCKWVNWFKAHRDLVTNGESLILAVPDGQSIDGIVFLGSGKASAVFFNPQGRTQTRHFLLPLGFAGLRPLGSDEAGAFPLTVTLAPFEVKTIDIEGNCPVGSSAASVPQG